MGSNRRQGIVCFSCCGTCLGFCSDGMFCDFLDIKGCSFIDYGKR